MSYIRNFLGWNTQKNIDNVQPNKIEKEVDGFVIFEKNQLNEQKQHYISGALNIRNISNNIVSGIKKITLGVLDIVSCANPFNKAPTNNKTPQQKAGMLSDTKSIQKLTEEIKLNYGIDVAYLKNKKGHLNVKNLMRLMKENQWLYARSEKLKNTKSPLDSLKLSANLCLISKNNAEILYNYICLACAKASDEGRDKQQMQYLFQANDVAEKMIKKYENYFEKITSKISKLENTSGKRKNHEKKRNELKTKLGLNQNTNRRNSNKKISEKKNSLLRPNINNKKDNILSTKSPKGIIGIYSKPYSLERDIDSKLFESKSTEESSVFDDFDTDIDSIKDGYNKTKAKYDEQNKLMNEQKKELSKLRKGHGRINKFFAQYGQNNVPNEEIDKEIEKLEKEVKNELKNQQSNS